MKKLWTLIDGRTQKRHIAFYIFLLVNTFSWTIPPFLIILAGCVLLHTGIVYALSAALTVAGLTGVFVGFFGGLLYLLSTQDALKPNEF